MYMKIKGDLLQCKIYFKRPNIRAFSSQIDIFWKVPFTNWFAPQITWLVHNFVDFFLAIAIWMLHKIRNIQLDCHMVCFFSRLTTADYTYYTPKKYTTTTLEYTGRFAALFSCCGKAAIILDLPRQCGKYAAKFPTLIWGVI